MRSRTAAEAGVRNRWRALIWVAPLVVVAVVGLYFVAGRGDSGGEGVAGSDDYPYTVGAPGPGEPAPPVKLPSTSGGTFDLAAYEGKGSVLLYFQEGLGCQPCWDQLVAMERDATKFGQLGIQRVVSITTDPLHLLAQKARDERITYPVL